MKFTFFDFITFRKNPECYREHEPYFDGHGSAFAIVVRGCDSRGSGLAARSVKVLTGEPLAPAPRDVRTKPSRSQFPAPPLPLPRLHGYS